MMDGYNADIKLVRDSLTGQSYEVHTLNARSQGRPLIVCLGLGSTAANSIGRMYLSTYSGSVQRPVYSLHPRSPVVKWPDIADRAASDLEVLSAAGVDEFDITGASSGAINATYVAREAGKRARILVTVSAVGTKSRAGYIRALPAQFVDSAVEALTLLRHTDDEARASVGSSNYFEISQYRALSQTMIQIAQTSLSGVVLGLDNTTRWVDIVGAKDSMTDYRDHQALVSRRNDKVPGSLEVYVLPNRTHLWAAHRHELGRLVADAVGDS